MADTDVLHKPIPRARLLDLMARLPERTTFAEALEALESAAEYDQIASEASFDIDDPRIRERLTRLLEERLREAREGQTISHEEVARRLTRWLA